MRDLKTCPDCKYENCDIDDNYCGNCGHKFNQYSSEDASDGDLDTKIRKEK